MRLFDTLSGKKRDFSPLRGNEVRIYTCGPSVYDYSHIGNFRTYLFEDILVRYLMYKGYKVKRVMNITDVEDKAIKAAREEGESIEKFERDKIRSFFSDFKKLGMLEPDVVAKASDYVPQMIVLIERIRRNGYSIRENSGIYFNVRKFKGYGQLRHLLSRKYFGKARGDDYSKEGLYDFRLWKFWTKGDGELFWESPFGKGRPGWHIECSAIAMDELGESIDIHCGGTDNIYPHHENEIAQSQSASGHKLANFWLHTKHLTIGKKKMSKRTGNVFYVSQLEEKGVEPKCLRYYLLSERYRHPLDFTIQQFKWKICSCTNTIGIVNSLKKIKKSGNGLLGRRIAGRMIKGFEGALDDDLNTKMAFRRIFTETGRVERLLVERKLTKDDARHIIEAVERINSVLGVF